MIYSVVAKDYEFLTEAEDTKEAFARFFVDVIDNEIPLERLGQIVKTVREDGEEVAFRTVPILVLLGRLSVSDGIKNIEITLHVDVLEAINILTSCMHQDEWMLDCIDKIPETNMETVMEVDEE